MRSILDSVKNKVGGGSIHEHFDDELIDTINLVILELRQIGIGPEEGFFITGDSETWNDYLGEDLSLLAGVPTVVGIKTRLLFDPPTSASVKESLEEQLREAMWRLGNVYEISL